MDIGKIIAKGPRRLFSQAIAAAQPALAMRNDFVFGAGALLLGDGPCAIGLVEWFAD